MLTYLKYVRKKARKKLPTNPDFNPSKMYHFPLLKERQETKIIAKIPTWNRFFLSISCHSDENIVNKNNYQTAIILNCMFLSLHFQIHLFLMMTFILRLQTIFYLWYRYHRMNFLQCFVNERFQVGTFKRICI